MGLAGMYGSHLAIPVSRSQGLNSFVGLHDTFSLLPAG
jgi:hypothetical protein